MVADGPDSISIRQIENGYIVNESGTGGNGQYKCREFFSPDKPEISVEGSPGAAPKQYSSLRKAIKHLKG